MRKFQKAEIDLIYNSLLPNEKMLWRGKPKYISNPAASAAVFMLSVFRLIKQEGNIFEWYEMSLILFFITIVVYMGLYIRKNIKRFGDIFYVVTSARVLVFDGKKGNITLSRTYSLIKILKLRKTILGADSLIFDIDCSDKRLKEIGFNNIPDAYRVFEIISSKLHHLRE